MGFLYSLSCVSAYKLTGNKEGKKAAILAARQLCSRFQEKGQFLQACGFYGKALSYRYTKREVYKEAFDRVLDYYLTWLPRDLIPYWNMTFNDSFDTDEPRDSSGASIVTYGLLVLLPVCRHGALLCRDLFL